MSEHNLYTASLEVAEKLGIYETTAADSIKVYSEQLGWDADDLSQEQVDEMVEIVRAGIEVEDMDTSRVMDELHDRVSELEIAEAKARVALYARNAAIVRATSAGARQIDIARVANLSVAMVRRIISLELHG